MWTPNFIFDILFPKFCLNCGKEGNYLCEDCKGCLQISGFHQKLSCAKQSETEDETKSQRPYPTQNLRDLYFAANYQNPLVKNLIQKFKYEPLVKELAQPLSDLIITHFQLIDNKPDFTGFVLIPVPLEKKKLKWRGFNQAEEIAKELADFFNLEILNGVLVKTKETSDQVDLENEKRKENIKGAFSCQDPEKIQGRKILLVDDVYTTGSTLEECARVLRDAGAKEIIGIVIARG